MRSNHSLLAVLALLSGTTVVRGQPEPSVATARLDVRAAPGCSSAADLSARIAARSPRVRFVTEGARYSIRIDLSQSRSGSIESDIVLIGPGGRNSSRRLVAGNCAEAADAVALIVAVTLDPSSLSAPPNTASNPGSPTTEGVARADSSDQNPLVNNKSTSAPDRSSSPEPSGAATEAPKSVNPTAVGERPAQTRSNEPPSRWRFGLVGSGQFLIGPAPAAMPGLSLHAVASLERDSVWAPAILLGVIHAWKSGLDQPGGTAAFRLDAAQLDGCALRFRLGRLESHWCGSLLAGQLTASGSNTRDPTGSIGRPFAAIGATTLLGARLSKVVTLSSRLGASANLVIDSFEFGSDVFHEISTVTLSAGLGVGMQLP